MVSETNELLRSLRRWVLACAILLGATGMTVADLKSLTTGTEGWAGQVAFYGGFLLVVSAALMLLWSASRALATD